MYWVPMKLSNEFNFTTKCKNQILRSTELVHSTIKVLFSCKNIEWKIRCNRLFAESKDACEQEQRHKIQLLWWNPICRAEISVKIFHLFIAIYLRHISNCFHSFALFPHLFSPIAYQLKPKHSFTYHSLMKIFRGSSTNEYKIVFPVLGITIIWNFNAWNLRWKKPKKIILATKPPSN